jgi:hypothetical protein
MTGPPHDDEPTHDGHMTSRTQEEESHGADGRSSTGARRVTRREESSQDQASILLRIVGSALRRGDGTEELDRKT